MQQPNAGKIKELVAKLTLEEKAGLCSGADEWRTKTVERLGIPAMMMSDGPSGLRKQEEGGDHLGLNDSIKAVSFPTGSAVAASFDKEIAKKLGETIAEECLAENLGLVLGPSVNIKRSPLCGRNFEYMSEDPTLAGSMATSYIQGVQDKGVGVSMKHYLANNQEHRRLSSDSVIDERTLREIYLAVFETPVKEAKPWTVMCSYNRVNGIHASEHPRFLTDILRDEWGFDGFVVSDWGAVSDRVAGLAAGLDLEMPSTGGINDAEIVKAVREGRLEEAKLDLAVERILNVVFRWQQTPGKGGSWNRKAHHALCREMAADCAVLLQNDEILPLAKGREIAVIGAFAEKPRYQGGGSSHINSSAVTSAIDALQAAGLPYRYAAGFAIDESEKDSRLADEAVALARDAEVAVLFLGLPDAYESEGFDRTHLRLPDNQLALLQAVAEAQPNTVVVLHNGAPIEMPWAKDVRAILEMYLGGQAVGGTTVDLLYGDKNPSGRLAETFPLRLEDNPSYLYYRGEGDRVEYREGVFVGYRYYDKKNMPVLFPFGHGLSYTSFAYSNLKLDKAAMLDTDKLQAEVTVTNTGAVAGKEVVQLYVASPADSDIIRPVRELRGFEKIELQPGESKVVHFTLGKRAFAYYNVEAADWLAPTGQYKVEIGHSSRDIKLAAKVDITCTEKLPRLYTPNTLFGDIADNKEAMEIVQPLLKGVQEVFVGQSQGENAPINEGMLKAMMGYLPLRSAVGFGHVPIETMNKCIAKLNRMER